MKTTGKRNHPQQQIHVMYQGRKEAKDLSPEPSQAIHADSLFIPLLVFLWTDRETLEANKWDDEVDGFKGNKNSKIRHWSWFKGKRDSSPLPLTLCVSALNLCWWQVVWLEKSGVLRYFSWDIKCIRDNYNYYKNFSDWYTLIYRQVIWMKEEEKWGRSSTFFSLDSLITLW